MGINIEALKAKLEKMNNRGQRFQNRQSSFWIPDYGTHVVRILPWPEEMEVSERPFLERWFYYGLGKKLVAPSLSQPDPVRELRDHLFEERSEANLALANKIRPKMRAFVPIVVRSTDGVPSEGDVRTEAKIWSIGQMVYKQLLEYLVDPEWGDITDLERGRDIKVTISDSGKKFPDGTVIRDVQVTAQPTQGILFQDKNLVKIALTNIPDINEIYPISTPEKLAEALERYMDAGTGAGEQSRGGQTKNSKNSTTSTPKTSSLDDEFDSLLNAD